MIIVLDILKVEVLFPHYPQHESRNFCKDKNGEMIIGLYEAEMLTNDCLTLEYRMERNSQLNNLRKIQIPFYFSQAIYLNHHYRL